MIPSILVSTSKMVKRASVSQIIVSHWSPTCLIAREAGDIAMPLLAFSSHISNDIQAYGQL